MTERSQEERDFVSRMARKVRAIKDERGITYSQVASECGVSLGRISGLMACHVLVREEHPKVRTWVTEWELRLHD